MTTINDPQTYRQMSQPFASREEADAAVDAFFDDLRAIRAKHKITDVHAVLVFSAMHEGAEAMLTSTCHLGNSNMALPMLLTGLETEEKRLTRVVEALREGHAASVEKAAELLKALTP